MNNLLHGTLSVVWREQLNSTPSGGMGSISKHRRVRVASSPRLIRALGSPNKSLDRLLDDKRMLGVVVDVELRAPGVI